MRDVEEYPTETAGSGYNKRPSKQSVQEVLDIIQRQQHKPRFPSNPGKNVANKSKTPLPAIRGKPSAGSPALDGSSDENSVGETFSAYEGSLHNMKHGELLNSTECFYINDKSDHGFQKRKGHAVDSMVHSMQREGTVHQLPPLSATLENDSSIKSQNGRGKDENKRTVPRPESRSRARPSTGYGHRRDRSSSSTEEINSNETRTLLDEGTTGVRRFSNANSTPVNGRPRTGYGRRSQSTDEASFSQTATLSSVELTSPRPSLERNDITVRNNAIKNDGRLTYDNNHRPVHAARSNELDIRYSPRDNGTEIDTTPGTTPCRPKSSKGRFRPPAPPRSCRSDSRAPDIVRPSAPTPPSPCLDDLDDHPVFGEERFSRNTMGQILTL